MKFRLFAILSIIFFSITLPAQISIGDLDIDYSNPREYEVGGITISGIQYIDPNVLIMLSGLTVGEKIKIPGEKISTAIENLWKQGLFENIRISANSIIDNTIFLNIHLEEKPRLSKFSFTGIKKGEADDLREKIKLSRGDVVTDNLIIRTSNIIKKHYVEKGFFNVSVNIKQEADTSDANNVTVIIEVAKKNKIKIQSIIIKGNENLADKKAKKTLKNTKEKGIYRIFKPSKFIEEEYKNDLSLLIEKYNELGYRDAYIVSDTFYQNNEKTININIDVFEGSKYYFRKISWVGNTKYSSAFLDKIIGIQKGDVYNQKVLETNLFMNMKGGDISSLYLDDGYLFFNITPVETSVENDSIDVEIRIYEGKQAIVRKVTLKGNTKTNDHVVIREIRTKPGELFNRSDIIRTQRELAQLRYFDPEKLGVNPKPNPQDGTVDIEYVVEEHSTDQIELSGGWGLNRVVGTAGISFNNFSINNIFKKETWRPLPSGDGQKLSLRAQSDGNYYQSYNLSFTEPWLGGKKPNALSISLYHQVQTNGLPKDDEDRGFIKINGLSVGIGQRLQWPDDFFTLYQGISFQRYNLKNYTSVFSFSNGNSNNLYYNIILGRASSGPPTFPKYGSELSLGVQVTPPYSIFSGKDYTTVSESDKYKNIEYHKWKFNGSWFVPLDRKAQKLVLNVRTKFGFLGLYNSDLGIAPFERFYVGGDGLTGFALDGREIVGLRGYANSSLTPQNPSGDIGGTIFNKYSLEIRYPVSLNPSATIYVMGFVEAGNAWSKFSTFNPFDVKRSAGFGIRIFLPYMGLLGLDWGYGFDKIPGAPNANKGQFHFSINNSID